MAVRVRCVALLFLLLLCTVGQAQAKVNPLSLPCPDAVDIHPCICIILPDYSMNMNCSEVKTNDDLVRVFSADFPFTDFDSLIINNNKHLRSVRIGDLGPTSYKKIHITNGMLESVVPTSFSGSYSTLTHLYLGHNSIFSFPFEDIHLFTKLKHLDIQDNWLKSFSGMSSPTLDFLYIRDNPLEQIAASDVKNLPKLQEIGLHNCGLKTIPPGTFKGLSALYRVHLEDNLLTTVDRDILLLTTTSNYVHLNSNSITSVAVNALKGVKGDIWIQDNQLKELKEEVWRPLFPYIMLNAARNPLTCGCDIAWLVLDGNYMGHLTEDVTCSDGELVHQLDPAIFSYC